MKYPGIMTIHCTYILLKIAIIVLTHVKVVCFCTYDSQNPKDWNMKIATAHLQAGPMDEMCQKDVALSKETGSRRKPSPTIFVSELKKNH